AKRSYFDSWRQNNTKSPRLGDGAAAAATASTVSAPTAQSMERDEEGDRDDEPQAADSTSANTSASASTSTSTAILATSTSTFQKRPISSSSSSSSSSYSVYDELNARDDQDAPTAVLDAAKELRRRIHEGVEDGTGLVIHRFHIRKRGDETVLINIDDSDSSSAEDTYTITTEMRDSLDEGLKMTTPVKLGSKTTHGTRKRKQQQQQQEADDTAERMARPRVNLMRPSSRAASRGNASSSSSSSSFSSSASSVSTASPSS
ncbi:MAG: hypothetical protein VX554_00840, partial [Candidatus Thermoplasmatota archaeon]|nr:hypothetical protein [Candidatus Thermoplasmatota archaeon]